MLMLVSFLKQEAQRLDILLINFFWKEMDQIKYVLIDNVENYVVNWIILWYWYEKLAYQMVKNHLRRRAMSHNRYRIPRKIRDRMNTSELDVIEKTQDPIRCRKHLRKPKLLMDAYIRRSKRDQWMETHLWHSKRMRMFRYF